MSVKSSNTNNFVPDTICGNSEHILLKFMPLNTLSGNSEQPTPNTLQFLDRSWGAEEMYLFHSSPFLLQV